MRIKTKLYLSSLTSIILVAALILTMIITSSRITGLNEQRAVSRQALQAVSELDILTYEYLLRHEKRAEQQWHLRYASLGKFLTALIDSEDTRLLIKNYGLISSSFSELKSLYENRQKIIQAGSSQEELNDNITTENRLVAQHLIASQSMVSKASQLAEKNVNDMLNAQTLGNNLTLTLGLILLLNGITTTLVVSNAVAKALHELRIGTDKVGQGNLNYKIGIKSKDEIGQVARTFNRMTANLKNIIATKTDLEREIGERKQAEKGLKESEKKLNKTQEIAHIGTWELNYGASHPYWSDETFRIYGYKPQEFIPTNEDFDRIVHPDDRQIIDSAYRESIRQNKNTYEPTVRIINQSTGKIRILHEKCEHTRDASGKIIRTIGMVQDITEQKQAENALRESEEKFRAVAETAKDAIISANSHGKIIYFNKGAQQIFGYTPEEVIGKPLTIIMPERFRKPHQQGFFYFLAGGQPRVMGKTLELAGRRKNGEEFPLELSLANWQINKEVFVTAIIRDITERKNLDQRKDDFITIAGHELRTPVSVIKMLNQTLQETLPDNPQALKYLQKIDQQTTLQANLINDLLDVSKIQTGKLEIRKKQFDLQNLVEETIEDMQETTQAHKLTIKGKICGKIFADREKIKQVLINFCSNAIKFSPEGGKIIIGCENNQKEIVVSVTDFGVGIPKKSHARIFERFYRVYGTGDRQYPGLGMGLYISYQITKLHNGNMWFKSTPGKGSTFYFSIPFKA